MPGIFCWKKQVQVQEMLWLLWQKEGGRCRLAYRFRLRLHSSLSESQGCGIWSRSCQPGIPPPGRECRISSCASLSRHRAFQCPSYCLPKGIQSIILLFVINDKPERREACPNGSCRSCLSEVLKSGSSLPNWTRHTHLVPTNEMTLFFSSFSAGNSFLIFWYLIPFSPCTHTFLLTPQPIPSTSCLWTSEGWHELSKGMSHIRLLCLNMDIK